MVSYLGARVLATACTHVPLGRDTVGTTGLVTDEATIHSVTAAVGAVVGTIDELICICHS